MIIKLLIHKKIIVPFWELVQRDVKMKQARFVNSITLNVHWQLEQHTILNCVIMKVVARRSCLLLGTNFLLENNKLDHLLHLFVQNLCTSTW